MGKGLLVSDIGALCVERECQKEVNHWGHFVEHLHCFSLFDFPANQFGSHTRPIMAWQPWARGTRHMCLLVLLVNLRPTCMSRHWPQNPRVEGCGFYKPCARQKLLAALQVPCEEQGSVEVMVPIAGVMPRCGLVGQWHLFWLDSRGWFPILFSHRSFQQPGISQGVWWFSRQIRIPGKNGEVTPRWTCWLF